MPLPPIDELFGRTQRSRFLNFFDIPHLLICALIVGIYLALLVSGRFERAENILLDFYFRRRPPVTVPSDIVLIEIDRESLLTIGSWPWPWSYHAQIIKILHEWQAKAILYDVAFKEGATHEEESILLEALSKTSEVYLPVNLEMKTGKKFWIHSMAVVLEPDEEKKVWEHSKAEFEKYAQALGHKNILQDGDGVVRRVSPYLSYAHEAYFYLPIKIGYDYLGKAADHNLDVNLPLDSRKHWMINWPGRWREAFKRYSYSEVVRSAQQIEKGLPLAINPAEFKNKICIVGTTVSDIEDFNITPLEASVPSIGIYASALENILQSRFLRPVPRDQNLLALCLLGFVASLLFVLLGNAVSFLLGITLAIGWMFFTYFLFVTKGIWLYTFHPLALILTLFICSAIYHLILSKKETLRLFNLATRDGLTGLYVIRHFREILNQAAAEAREKKQPLSVILLDIDNFKLINDQYGHSAGDKVLKTVAQIIYGCFRTRRPLPQIDFAARYGGEEFIVMLRDASLKNASFEVAERIRKAVQTHLFEWEGQVIPITISLGVATLHAGEIIPDLMVRRADEALYRAKRTGKNRVCVETFATNSGPKN